MSIADKLNKEFASNAEFSKALEDALKEEMAPLQNQISDLTKQLNDLGVAVKQVTGSASPSTSTSATGSSATSAGSNSAAGSTTTSAGSNSASGSTAGSTASSTSSTTSNASSQASTQRKVGQVSVSVSPSADIASAEATALEDQPYVGSRVKLSYTIKKQGYIFISWRLKNKNKNLGRFNNLPVVVEEEPMQIQAIFRRV